MRTRMDDPKILREKVKKNKMILWIFFINLLKIINFVSGGSTNARKFFKKQKLFGFFQSNFKMYFKVNSNSRRKLLIVFIFTSVL